MARKKTTHFCVAELTGLHKELMKIEKCLDLYVTRYVFQLFEAVHSHKKKGNCRFTWKCNWKTIKQPSSLPLVFAIEGVSVIPTRLFIAIIGQRFFFTAFLICSCRLKKRKFHFYKSQFETQIYFAWNDANLSQQISQVGIFHACWAWDSVSLPNHPLVRFSHCMLSKDWWKKATPDIHSCFMQLFAYIKNQLGSFIKIGRPDLWMGRARTIFHWNANLGWKQKHK